MRIANVGRGGEWICGETRDFLGGHRMRAANHATTECISQNSQNMLECSNPKPLLSARIQINVSRGHGRKCQRALCRCLFQCPCRFVRCRAHLGPKQLA